MRRARPWRYPGAALLAALALALCVTSATPDAEAAFPGTNGKLFFMSNRTGAYDIYTMQSDGTAVTNVTANSEFEEFPDVSPDGQRITFGSSADGDSEIYVMNADGTGRTRVTNNTVFDARPAWSPDGTKIVFSRAGTQLVTINVDGTGEQVIEAGPNADLPEWSPDGTRIVFSASRSGNNDIYAVNATGGGLTRLTATPELEVSADWSPDGTKIAYVREVCAPFCYARIWVMNADGTGQTGLTSAGSRIDAFPAWSPDGTQIAFSRTDATGNWDLWRMDADGTDQTLLTDPGTHNTQVDWATGPPPGLEIENVVELADPVERFARFEATFDLSESFANPFDPDEISVDVTFTSPTGRIQTVPAFWYRPFTVGGSPDYEQYTPAGPAGWRVRFAPDEVGTYGYSIAAVADSGTAVPVIGSFTSTASTRTGFVRLDDRNPLHLRFDNDAPYLPLGHNVAFEDSSTQNGTGFYSSFFTSLDAAGENWSRVWMTDFNRSALEWGAGHYSGFYGGTGVYSLESAWRMDAILGLAEQHGIALQLVLNDHGQFSTWVNARWARRCAAADTPPCEPGDQGFDPGNAYSSQNGGPVDVATPQAFFSDPDARRLHKQRLRYLAGRYGAYTSLLAWELFNEVQFTGTNAVNAYGNAGVRADIVSWHDEMSSYLDTIDAHDHLVTTSAWEPDATPGLWGLSNLDLVQVHTYSSPPSGRTAELRTLVPQLKSQFGKPVLVGELGLGSGDPEAGFDPTTFGGTTANREHLLEGTHLHNAAWAGALTGSLGAYWWWGNYVAADPSKNRVAPRFPQNERQFPPLVAYLAGEDWAPLGLETAPLTTSASVTAVGLSSSTLAYVWIRDTQNEYGMGARPGNLAGRTISGATVSIGGLGDGEYRIRVYDTWGAGGVTSTLVDDTSGGTLTVSLPAFTRDVALKLERLGPSGRSLVDQPDERTGSQIHLVYAIPADGVDRELDLDGTITGSVAVAQAWLESETGGRSFRLDTADGEPDVTFVRLSRTDEEIADEGARVRDAIEDELVAAGLDDPDKRYAVHYDGVSTFACGGGAWPPTLPGTVAALYLHGLPDSPVPCETNPFAPAGGSPGYWEFSWLHELVHTLGFVAECAPSHTRAGHVSEPTNDLMYAGDEPWTLSGVVLDDGNDDYFAHGEAGCADLADSAYLADLAQGIVAAGGTVTTDGDGNGPTPTDPLEVSVTTPTGGRISIDEGPASQAAPAGFTFVGQRVEITAPAATVGSPLRIVFAIDATLLPAGESIETVQVFRNATLVGECPGATTASPNPCVTSRVEPAGGGGRVTILTSQASPWYLGVRGGVLAPSCAGAPPTGAIVGTSRGEKLVGTEGDDVIFALGGEDTVDASGGNDVVCGGTGKDKLAGGQGNDAVAGGDGGDQIDGGPGDDRLTGETGDDTLVAGPGDDVAIGGLGKDGLDGGPGVDTCRGETRKGCER